AGMASAKTFSSPHIMQRIVQTLATGTTKNNAPQNRRKDENEAIAVRTQWQRICVSAVDKRSHRRNACAMSCVRFDKRTVSGVHSWMRDPRSCLWSSVLGVRNQ